MYRQENSKNRNPNVQISPTTPAGKRPAGMFRDVLNRYGRKVEDATRKAEVLADNVWNHLKVSPHLTDAAMAKLSQGTKVLTEGGHENLYHREFDILPGEKLLKTYACYISSSSGPVIGTLYISTKKVAFCSDNPLCHCSPSGRQDWLYYKAVIQLDKLHTVNPATNLLNPSERYIHIVTRDGSEFWFMGFISYDKALKTLTEALQGVTAFFS